MTVQELIEHLQIIEDKNLLVMIEHACPYYELSMLEDEDISVAPLSIIDQSFKTTQPPNIWRGFYLGEKAYYKDNPDMIVSSKQLTKCLVITSDKYC